MLCNDFDTFFKLNVANTGNTTFDDCKTKFEKIRSIANKRHTVTIKIIETVKVLIHEMQNKVLLQNNLVSSTEIEKILDSNNEILAIIIRADYDNNGITFVTPDDYSQQLAYMHHPKNHVILPHIHNEVKREIYYTKEVLLIKEGKLRCDFYSCICSCNVYTIFFTGTVKC